MENFDRFCVLTDHDTPILVKNEANVYSTIDIVWCKMFKALFLPGPWRS